MVGVDGVDMELWFFGLGIAGRRQDVDFELGPLGESGDGRSAVAAEIGRRRNSLAECFFEAGCIEAREDGVERGAGAVASHDDGNLLGREAALGGFAAAATRWSGKTAPPTLERLENEGLIGFDDARKALGFVELESGEKPMPPPEGGARVDLATLGRLGQALPFDQGSRLIEPAILLVQAGHRSAGERIESLAAFDAAIARQTSRFAPRAGSERAAARTSPPRMTLLCDLPENIARARFAKRRRSRFAAFLGPVRVRRRRPRYEDLNALLGRN